MSGMAAYADSGPRPIIVGITPAALHDQHALLAEWRTYLEIRLKRPVEFVQRDRYRETMDLLQQQKVDFAWICDYPYVELKKDVRLLAVPINQGKPTYRAYLIVPARDKHTRSIADLKGAIFAFADPHSNTGYLSPRYELMRLGKDPDHFFKRTFFTWSHRKSIEAVAAGLVQASSVDSYVWDSLNRFHPEITAKTRIVWKSAEYGFPPLVANRTVSEADFSAMKNVLLDMKNNIEGRTLFTKLNLDGFVSGSPKFYKSVADMSKLFDEY